MLRCGFVRACDLSAMLLTESKSGIVTEDTVHVQKALES